jgi:hypothetical protein
MNCRNCRSSCRWSRVTASGSQVKVARALHGEKSGVRGAAWLWG